MRVIKTNNGHEIKFYDAIDEMPIVRYHKYNKFMVMGEGCGAGIDDIRQKLSLIGKYIDSNLPEKAKVELGNINMQLAMNSADIDTKSRALACIVKSIDGIERNDITDDGLKETSDILDKILSVGERDITSNDVKKKIEAEIAYYFPKKAQHDNTMLSLQKKRLELMYDAAIREVDNKDEIAKIDSKILKNTSVIDYGEFEKESDVAFIQGLQSISKQLKIDASKMSVIEYYSATEMLEEQAKKLEQLSNKHK